jgi:hypothetical protein
MLFKEIAMSRLNELTDRLVLKDGSLTREQAMAKVLETPEGKEAYEWYTSKYANMELEDAIQEIAKDARLREMGYSSYGEAVAKAASDLAPGDPAKGLELVRKLYPNLFEAYERESCGG